MSDVLLEFYISFDFVADFFIDSLEIFDFPPMDLCWLETWLIFDFYLPMALKGSRGLSDLRLRAESIKLLLWSNWLLLSLLLLLPPLSFIDARPLLIRFWFSPTTLIILWSLPSFFLKSDIAAGFSSRSMGLFDFFWPLGGVTCWSSSCKLISSRVFSKLSLFWSAV